MTAIRGDEPPMPEIRHCIICGQGVATTSRIRAATAIKHDHDDRFCIGSERVVAQFDGRDYVRVIAIRAAVELAERVSDEYHRMVGSLNIHDFEDVISSSTSKMIPLRVEYNFWSQLAVSGELWIVASAALHSTLQGGDKAAGARAFLASIRLHLVSTMGGCADESSAGLTWFLQQF
jgi:hypothetical protein